MTKQAVTKPKNSAKSQKNHKQSKKAGLFVKFKRTFSSPNTVPVIILSTIVLFVVAYVIAINWQGITGYIDTNFSPHGRLNRADTHKYMENFDKKITSKGGQIVYDKIIDDGCGSNPTTWLNTADTRVCIMSFKKIFKAKGDSKTNLWAMHELIVNSEWKGLPDEYFLTHREGGGREYLNKVSGEPSIYFSFLFNDDPRGKIYTPQDQFGIDEDIPLTGDEYLYGVWVSGAYRP